MTGPELRAAREQLGLSQAGLAALLDVSRYLVSKWEREDVRIAHPRILELALTELRRRKR